MIPCRALALALALAPAAVSAAGRPVTLVSLDGIPLAAQIYEAPAPPAPGVVLVHMLSRSKADWDEVAGRLQQAGVTALAIDLRGHGGSSGSPGDLGAMVRDVAAAVQWLSARPATRPGTLGLAGASLGANLAALAAADLAVVRSLALISPVSDYRGVRIDSAAARRLADRPLWLAASAEDALSLRTLQDLAAAGAAPREQHVSNTAAHGMALVAADRELSRSLVDWFRRTLVF